MKIKHLVALVLSISLIPHMQPVVVAASEDVKATEKRFRYPLSIGVEVGVVGGSVASEGEIKRAIENVGFKKVYTSPVSMPTGCAIDVIHYPFSTGPEAQSITVYASSGSILIVASGVKFPSDSVTKFLKQYLNKDGVLEPVRNIFKGKEC